MARPISMVNSAHIRVARRAVFLLLLSFLQWGSNAQTDSIPTMGRDLGEAEVTAERPESVRWMQSIGVEGIYTGMKSRVFNWAESDAVQSAQHHRQMLISVPGANIWQSDAAGLQLGIGVRGLSPSRSSHLSVRQNGMPIAADPLGYPEAYYTPPTRAVREVRMVSGAGALQYGSQLGGMLDFVMRDGREHEGLWSSAALTSVVYPETLAASSEGGLRHFFNGFGEVGWQSPEGQFHGYAALEQKSGSGWRQNTWFQSRTGLVRAGGALASLWVWDVDAAWMSRLEKQPGGLTDAQFSLDPRASFRDRNHFRVTHNSVALRIRNEPSGIRDWLWSARLHGLQAERASLGYLGFPNRVDPGTERELISGRFRHAGIDLKGVKRWYAQHGGVHAFTFGFQALKGKSLAMQGQGAPGEGPDFAFVTADAGDGSNYVFPNAQLAAHVQAAWSPIPGWVFTPGWRLEFIDTRADGQYRESIFDGAGNLIEDSVFVQVEQRKRAVGLPGLGFSHKFGDLEAYGNAVANYRAINFSDIQLRGIGRKIDPNIRDERGRNVDLGLRGALWKKLKFDCSVFQLNYRDRIGLYATTIPDPVVIQRVVLLRSNIADARTRGVELTLGGVLFERKEESTRLEGLLTGSWMKSQYLAGQQSAFQGKEVEYVPDFIVRSALIFTHKAWQWDLGLHAVGQQFTEATNAVFTPDAIHGEIPAFGVVDFGFGWTSSGGWSIRCAVDNATNAQYFTRRSAAYPGPGILPADGRSLQLTVGFQGWR
jgi:Fe(3+) dicitrate transport protein